MKKLASILLSIALLLSLTTPAMAADTPEGTNLRLVSTEGTVKVNKQNGRKVTIRENTKLYSGYTIKTLASSYAYISLDDTKAIKLDASTTVEIRKSGKKLQVLLSAGKIFFNVKAPLKDDESLQIRTSTIVTGIRGTAGMVGETANGSTVALLDGHVTVQSIDPKTGESTALPLNAGEMASLGKNSGTSDTASALQKTALLTKDVPGFVAVEMSKDADLQEKVVAQTQLDVATITKQADATLLQDEKQAKETQEAVDKILSEQNKPATPQTPNTGSGGGGTGGSGGNTGGGDSGGSGGNPGGGGSGENPGGGDSGDSGENPGGGDSGDSGENPGGGDSGDSSENPGGDLPPQPSEITLNGNITEEKLKNALANYTNITFASNAFATINYNVTVGKNQTWKLQSGASLTLDSNATLTVNGIIENSGTITIRGTANFVKATAQNVEDPVDAPKTVALKNSGTVVNEGVLHIDGLLENSSVLENKTSGQWTLAGRVVNSGTMSNKGTVELLESASLESSGQIKNEADATWTNQGAMKLSAAFINNGNFVMKNGAVQCVDVSDTQSLLESREHGIVFLGGLFSSNKYSEVLPDNYMSDQSTEMTNLRGTQENGKKFVLARGLDGFLGAIGSQATTILMPYLPSGYVRSSDLTIQADQDVTLQFEEIGNNVSCLTFNQDAKLMNNGTLNLTVNKTRDSMDSSIHLKFQPNSVLENKGTLSIAATVSTEPGGSDNHTSAVLQNEGTVIVEEQGKVASKYCAIENATNGSVTVLGSVSSQRSGVVNHATAEQLTIQQSGIVEVVQILNDTYAIQGPFCLESGGSVRAKQGRDLCETDAIPEGYEVTQRDNWFLLTPITNGIER